MPKSSDPNKRYKTPRQSVPFEFLKLGFDTVDTGTAAVKP